MSAVGKAVVTIDDAAIKARMRDLLAQAWAEGYEACDPHGPAVPNPYRDEAST